MYENAQIQQWMNPAMLHKAQNWRVHSYVCICRRIINWPKCFLEKKSSQIFRPITPEQSSIFGCYLEKIQMKIQYYQRQNSKKTKRNTGLFQSYEPTNLKNCFEEVFGPVRNSDYHLFLSHAVWPKTVNISDFWDSHPNSEKSSDVSRKFNLLLELRNFELMFR